MRDDDDRDPADVFENPRHPQPGEMMEELADTKILTERQAEVYVRRSLELEPREAVAEYLGYETVSGLDSVHQTAKKNVADAEWVVKLLDAYRNPPLPTECSECGETLGGRWVETDDGDARCLSCGGVEDVA